MQRRAVTSIEPRAAGPAVLPPAQVKRGRPRGLRSPRSAALAALVVTAVLGGATTRVSAAPPVAAPAAAPAVTYAEECGSCHVAYPARLLGPAQWFAVLNALDEHYGVDATVDPATLARIAAHVGVTAGVPHAGANAGVAADDAASPTASPTASAAPAGPRPLPRITQQRWFVREHREARVPAGGKISQCDACHAGAARGNFDEGQLLASARGRGRNEENDDERD